MCTCTRIRGKQQQTEFITEWWDWMGERKAQDGHRSCPNTVKEVKCQQMALKPAAQPQSLLGHCNVVQLSASWGQRSQQTGRRFGGLEGSVVSEVLCHSTQGSQAAEHQESCR